MNSAYLYVRFSTDEQRKKVYSLPEQEETLPVNTFPHLQHFINPRKGKSSGVLILTERYFELLR